MEKPLIILTGPTAVGKTELSLKLAREVGGEIISADSMQVYRGMDIGSAKIMPEEMGEIPHHLIDILEPEEEFNVVLFHDLAKKAVEEICGRGHVPIVAGGTGFYIQALLYDIDFTENESDRGYRDHLEAIARNEGAQSLHRMLEAVDPVSALQIHCNNIKRVIRALEFYQQTGTPISLHNERERQKESPYRHAYFVLTDDRSRLYERIDRRVDIMMEKGLYDEVRSLWERGIPRNAVSMQGLGYKELLACLEGEYSLEEAVRIIKRDTRHFAKRQLTWFRRERDVIWLDRSRLSSDQQILEEMLRTLKEKEIIRK